MFLIDCLAVNRYIAKTLYGDDDEDVSPQNSSVEEPKVLGINPGSTEKVCFKFWTWNYFIILLFLNVVTGSSILFWFIVVLLVFIDNILFSSFRFFWRVGLMDFMYSLVRTGRDTYLKEPLFPMYANLSFVKILEPKSWVFFFFFHFFFIADPKYVIFELFLF